MNGIQTQSGIDLWLNNQRQFVKEWDRGALLAAQVAKVIMFTNAAEGTNISNSATGWAAALVAARPDTSLKSTGKFQNENFTATHLGLELENQVVDSAVAAADLLPTVADVKEFNARTWFSMYFTAGNDPHDEGQYTDFPSGRGMRGFVTSTADTAAANQHSNGEPTQAALVPMKRPYRCTADTRPRLEIEILHGALGLSVAAGLRATVHGFKT